MNETAIKGIINAYREQKQYTFLLATAELSLSRCTVMSIYSSNRIAGAHTETMERDRKCNQEKCLKQSLST